MKKFTISSDNEPSSSPRKRGSRFATFFLDRFTAWIPAFAGMTTLLLLVLSPANLHARANYGEASDLFNVGAGARSMAMGGAFTGLADDASASYFNPAGLAFLDEHQLMVMHAPLFIDSSYNYIASAHPLGDKWGSLAFSDALLLSDGYQVRDKFNNLTSNNGSINNSAIFGSYARKLNQKISAGVNAKFIQQKIAGFSGNTLGIDVGFMYRFAPVLRLGAAFANLNSPSITLLNAEDVYRPVTRVGVASDVFRGRLTLSADIIKSARESNQFAAGAEYALNNLFSLRTGFNANHSYTFGMGMNINTLRIDYAFSDTDVGAFNKVSLTWAWHNIYKTELDPPMKEGRAVYPLAGFENMVAFKTVVPHHTVARWTLLISDKDGQEVRTLQADLRPPESIVWDAKNTVGEPVVDGTYSYHFVVNYKNGKIWQNQGELKLSLPDHEQKEVIDMTLQLNGTKENELQNAQAVDQDAPALPAEIPAQ